MKKHIIFILLALIALVFVVAFGMTTYRYYQAIHSDDPLDPYISVEKGNATIARGDIAIDLTKPESYEIKEKDIIITRDDSLAMVVWPDHSITRLSANSRLIIERMQVANDYSKIELVATLESGKSWSNIVRTLYPDSRIEFKLPKSGTVAGVRGTVFEINLDDNYIHSVDHSVTLKNTFGNIVTLLPGEAVQADNILKKITTALDTTWISINQAKDDTYMTVRDTSLRATYSLLAGKDAAFGIWDRFVRWILSWFSVFQDISVIESIQSGITEGVAIPQTILMKWYQSFQGQDFVLERDKIRGTIITIKDTFTNGDQIIENLARGSLWDMASASGFTLQNTQAILNTYSQKTGINLDLLTNQFKKIDTNALSNESKIIYEKLFK
ncbi:FecR family protein [Candidatus Gracilibacteria bacterium]|nr:FecR family protein [Candidatus Gracilibacteria bacterium]